jgi:hypothetical protein
MAAVGIEMMTAWGAGVIAQRLSMLTAMLAAGLQGLDVRMWEPRVRSPHILTLGFADGMPAGLIEALAAQNVYVASRVGQPARLQ